MRKIIALLLVIICAFSMVACSNENNRPDGTPNKSTNSSNVEETVKANPIYSLQGQSAEDIVDCIMDLDKPLDLSQKINYKEFYQNLRDTYSRRNEDEYSCDEITHLWYNNIEEQMDGTIGKQSSNSHITFHVTLHLRDYEIASKVYDLLFEKTKDKYDETQENKDGTWWESYGWCNPEEVGMTGSQVRIVSLQKRELPEPIGTYYVLDFSDYFE